jgi:hypothetical protein
MSKIQFYDESNVKLVLRLIWPSGDRPSNSNSNQFQFARFNHLMQTSKISETYIHARAHARTHARSISISIHLRHRPSSSSQRLNTTFPFMNLCRLPVPTQLLVVSPASPRACAPVSIPHLLAPKSTLTLSLIHSTQAHAHAMMDTLPGLNPK